MKKRSYRQAEQTTRTRMDNAYTKEEKERKGERRMKRRSEEGITLIALVVTIVILIILATISISALFGENGLIKKAQEAKQHQTNAVAMEEGEMDKLADEYANMLEEGDGGGTVTPPTISPSTSYVGYYANLDDDPEPDGKKGSGQWGDDDGNYSIPVVSSGLKSYTISETKYSGKFGNKEVISVVEGSQGADRFYVMALSDIDSSTHMWNANGSMNVVTQTGFGTGKSNTAAVMEQYTGDLWGLIGTQVAQGWFVPSKEEWSAFAEELGINSSNYSSTFGLSTDYWSSSQSNTNYAWFAHFNNGYMLINFVNYINYVRLSATF